MVTKKGLTIAVLVTFFLTSTLFMIQPTRSQTGTGQYDPWVDSNDDGWIDIYDAITLANHFNTFGIPINKTALLLNLQDRVSSLEEQANRLKTIRFYTSNETMTNETLWKDAASFTWPPQNRTHNFIIQAYFYCQTLTNDSSNYQIQYRIIVNDIEWIPPQTLAYNSTEYQQSSLARFGPWNTDLPTPNQSTYTFKFQVWMVTKIPEPKPVYMKDINLLLEVMDGLPPT